VAIFAEISSMFGDNLRADDHAESLFVDFEVETVAEI
jgi:hypothetical protein